jgi:hypothetical protein
MTAPVVAERLGHAPQLHHLSVSTVSLLPQDRLDTRGQGNSHIGQGSSRGCRSATKELPGVAKRSVRAECHDGVAIR